ncbi:hypothetical protein [uncultured Victivallis sp.]|uniref:hypothetical protein n=1 Tax=uncultured Victivallis sp. TaxID=354118 RepID=UPI002584A531|nr:hypothetical protein [uncultured Victivallis sp.]
MKNEEFCAICLRTITKNENVAYRVNLIEEEVSNVCSMDCFHAMEEDYHDNN